MCCEGGECDDSGLRDLSALRGADALPVFVLAEEGAMSSPDPALVVAVRKQIEQRIALWTDENDKTVDLDSSLVLAIAALVASWVGPLEEWQRNAQHILDCNKWNDDSDFDTEPCNCGKDAALAALPGREEER